MMHGKKRRVPLIVLRTRLKIRDDEIYHTHENCSMPPAKYSLTYQDDRVAF